jgi:hypothetical protein
MNSYSYAIVEGTSYVGGIVGYTTGAPYIINCYNRGDVTLRTTTVSTKKVGGVLGATTTAWMSYCYNTGTVTVNGADMAASAGGLCGSYYASRTPVSSYYLAGCAPSNGNTIGFQKTETEMLQPAFVDSINADQFPEMWSEDLAGAESINGGFPVLMWQIDPTSAVASIETANHLLMQNSPNPVFGETRISFKVTSNKKVTIKLFDLKGKEISTIADRFFAVGDNEITFDTSALPAGIYTYRMQYGNKNEVRKMVVL